MAREFTLLPMYAFLVRTYRWFLVVPYQNAIEAVVRAMPNQPKVATWLLLMKQTSTDSVPCAKPS